MDLMRMKSWVWRLRSTMFQCLLPQPWSNVLSSGRVPLAAMGRVSKQSPMRAGQCMSLISSRLLRSWGISLCRFMARGNALWGSQPCAEVLSATAHILIGARVWARLGWRKALCWFASAMRREQHCLGVKLVRFWCLGPS